MTIEKGLGDGISFEERWKAQENYARTEWDSLLEDKKLSLLLGARLDHKSRTFLENSVPLGVSTLQEWSRFTFDELPEVLRKELMTILDHEGKIPVRYFAGVRNPLIGE